MGLDSKDTERLLELRIMIIIESCHAMDKRLYYMYL